MAFIATPESIAALGLTRLRPRSLQPHHFWVMIAIAAAIHALILLAVQYWPSSEPEFTPRAIQIRLGGGRPIASVPTAAHHQRDAAVAIPTPRPKPAATSVAPVRAPAPAPKPAPTPKIAPKPIAKPLPKPTIQAAARPQVAPSVAPLPPASERKRPAQNPTQDPPAAMTPMIPLPAANAVATAIPTGSTMPAIKAELAPLPQLAALEATGTTVAVSGAARAPVGPGVPEGSPEAKLIRARYEQVVAQWLQKYQTYPAAAKMLGQQGQPVLRIRMDRGGDVKFSGVDKSSGYRLIDDAALAMVKRASPFPRPPQNYPGEEKLIEFLIPVAFRIAP